MDRRKTFLRFTWTTILTALLISVLLWRIGGHTVAANDPKDSAEMKRIFDEDQGDRKNFVPKMTPKQQVGRINTVGSRDAQRRKRVMELLKENTLQTGNDFEEAAFVFQHGDKSDDYLLAHTLAMVAMAKGKSNARWIAAATLDRYLQKIKQPQIFGTQYSKGPNASDKWSQDPYDRELVPDAFRNVVCVPDLASQQETVKSLNEGKDFSPAHVPGC
jgi:hypothetical protein